MPMCNVDHCSPSATFSYWPAIPPPRRQRLTVLPDHACPYLPGRVARSRAFWATDLSPERYVELMDAGFRRSGRIIYQPICSGCRGCQPIRIAVAGFRPNKSQRRCGRRNADLAVEIGPAAPSSEKFDLYTRYVREWHGSAEESEYDKFVSFLYDSPVETIDVCHRNADGRLLAVGVCDISAHVLSSVYFYFDPSESARSLGTYGAMKEIDLARERQVAYYYLGYWIDGCRSMEYKSGLRPSEVLWPDRAWRAEPVNIPYGIR